MGQIQDTRIKDLTDYLYHSNEVLYKAVNDNLDRMRTTVDEKLENTLNTRLTKSFSAVNERLEQVYKGLGQMQNLAEGVGDLKKVLPSSGLTFLNISMISPTASGVDISLRRRAKIGRAHV